MVEKCRKSKVCLNFDVISPVVVIRHRCPFPGGRSGANELRVYCATSSVAAAVAGFDNG